MTQADSYRTRLEPFGRNHSLLIVCLNSTHAEKVAQGFQVPAMYLPGWGCALTGHRFDKIIVFQPHFNSRTDEDRFTRWYYEQLPAHLGAGKQGNIWLV